MEKSLILFLVFIPFITFSQVAPDKTPPQPKFFDYTLGMAKQKAINISPAHKIIPENTLGLSAIVFHKDKLKWAIWFYKNKLQGILIRGKIKKDFRKKIVQAFKQQFGMPGYTFEYGFPHYYWYFYRKSVLYTIEIKYFLVDVHYSISDTGKGPKP